jgi:hypothetical protein
MGSAKETHERHIVVCMDSDCRGWHPQQVKQLYRSASVAVERWNTRTPSHPVPADSLVVKRTDLSGLDIIGFGTLDSPYMTNCDPSNECNDDCDEWARSEVRRVIEHLQQLLKAREGGG